VDEPPPLNDMLLDLTYAPASGPRWTQRPSEMKPERNVANLYWRPSTLNKPPQMQQRDALGSPLVAGEVYLSSRHGLLPVTVEGLRWLIDKEASR
jgi:hypothetical protein